MSFDPVDAGAFVVEAVPGHDKSKDLPCAKYIREEGEWLTLRGRKLPSNMRLMTLPTLQFDPLLPTVMKLTGFRTGTAFSVSMTPWSSLYVFGATRSPPFTTCKHEHNTGVRVHRCRPEP
jgi:hypothetical protein